MTCGMLCWYVCVCTGMPCLMCQISCPCLCNSWVGNFSEEHWALWNKHAVWLWGIFTLHHFCSQTRLCTISGSTKLSPQKKMKYTNFRYTPTIQVDYSRLNVWVCGCFTFDLVEVLYIQIFIHSCLWSIWRSNPSSPSWVGPWLLSTHQSCVQD